MSIAVILNIITIPISLLGFYQAYRMVKKEIFLYYTEISNLIGLLSVFFYLFNLPYAAALRYTGLCMLTMTALISLCVLSVMDGGIRKNMIEGNTLCHHTLVPLLTFVSYVFFEPHSNLFILPVSVSVAYGLLMFYLNYKKVLDGPYPFFRIHEQGYKMSVVWLLILAASISAISFGILCIAG